MAIFITLNDLITQLRKAEQQHKLENKIRAFIKPSVLIIDEIGYLNLDHQSAHYLFQVISRRYEHGSIILTSNKDLGEWEEMVGDRNYCDRDARPTFALRVIATD